MFVSPFDQFTYRTFVGAQPSNHTGLPLAYDAEPFWISNQISGRGTGAILASNVSNSEIVIYKGGPKTYVNQTLQAFTLQTDLTGLNQLGSTLTSLPGGVPGQVSTATEGSWTLVAYTNRVGDRMSVQTLQSGDYGNHWNVTYSSTSTRGMVLDPQVVSSPAGYFYLTWRDSGVGPWEVDYAVLSTSGSAVLNSSTIPGAGGTVSARAESPSIAVDDLERPLVAWDSYPYNQTSNSSVGFTGGFLSPLTLTRVLNATFHNLTVADYYKAQAITLQRFNSSVNFNLTLLQNDVSSSSWCGAATVLLVHLYANLTQNIVYPLLNASPFFSCGNIQITPHGTELVAAMGPYTASTVLSTEVQWLAEALGYGTFPAQTWPGAPSGRAPSSPSDWDPGGPPDPGRAADRRCRDRVLVAPLVINPNAVWLNTTGEFTTYVRNTSTPCSSNGVSSHIVSVVTVAPATYRVNVSENFSGPGPYGPPPAWLNRNVSNDPQRVPDEPDAAVVRRLEGQDHGDLLGDPGLHEWLLGQHHQQDHRGPPRHENLGQPNCPGNVEHRARRSPSRTAHADIDAVHPEPRPNAHDDPMEQ